MGKITINGEIYGSNSTKDILDKNGKILQEVLDEKGNSSHQELTLEEYNALPEKNKDIVYFIKDADEKDLTTKYNKNLADFYLMNKDYIIGDYCIFNNQLYEFIEDKPAGDWDESKVKEITIKDKIEVLNDNLITIKDKIEVLNDNLIAESGQSFKFTYNADLGKYGYIVTDGEGADTFCPFSDSDKYKTQIINALTNSNMGLTEESTWEEIIEALNIAYPYEFNILPIANKYFGTWTGSGSTTFTDDMMTVYAKTRDGTYGSSTYSSKKSIDLTNFKTLSIYGQDIATINGGTADSRCTIKMTGKKGTFTLYNRSEHLSSGSKTYGIAIDYDIKDLTGEYSFIFDFYYYIDDDTIKVNLNTFKLTAE